MSKNSGFTLIEMVVVLAVVAILAAILTPTIAKNINDAKISRANNEAQVIAAAMGSFYKDVGRWPTGDGVTLADTVRLLTTTGGDMPAAHGTIVGEEDWLTTGGAWSGTQLDNFENHLVANDPGGVAGVIYPNDATVPKPELRWKGPYITELKADPWGSYYACNIYFTYFTTTNYVGVFSAGQDRTAATVTAQAVTGVTVGEDDVLYRLQ